jgi:hypothetical protein
VGETLLEFTRPVEAPDGTLYQARACGSPMDEGTWQGWIEFIHLGTGQAVRTARETTQPNRADTEYWATGLTDVYLEGALKRALTGPHVAPRTPAAQPSIFSGPSPAVTTRPDEAGPTSILDPFSVYEKGEALLRKQLRALSAWHLVNIAREYELSDLDADTLNRMPAVELVELIVAAVRAEIERRHLA